MGDVQSQIACVLVGQQESALSLTQHRPVSRKRKARCGEESLVFRSQLLSSLLPSPYLTSTNSILHMRPWRIGGNPSRYLAPPSPSFVRTSSLRPSDTPTLHFTSTAFWKTGHSTSQISTPRHPGSRPRVRARMFTSNTVWPHPSIIEHCCSL